MVLVNIFHSCTMIIQLENDVSVYVSHSSPWLYNQIDSQNAFY